MRELKLDEQPTIHVFNKIDRLDEGARAALPPGAIEVSASTGAGILIPPCDALMSVSE